MPPPADLPPLPPSVLAALGLAIAGCSGKACLTLADTSSPADSAPGQTTTSTYTPGTGICLQYTYTDATPDHTGGSGSGTAADSGGSGGPGGSGPPARARVLDRLELERRLPPDVIERLRR